jgi:hypothetical protein
VRFGLALAALGIVTASCSSTPLQRDAGQLPVDAAGGDVANPQDNFIMADVDGVTIRADMQAGAYFWSGLVDGWLDADARNGEWVWAISVRNTLGSSVAADVTLSRVGSAATVFVSYTTGGLSEVTVTATAPHAGDVLEGTFSATLARLGGPAMTATVTNGSFRLARVDEMPPPL